MRFAAACRRCADWLPVRIVLRGANAATRAHVARVCACDKTRRDEKRRRSRRLLFLLPRPRRELASVLAPTTRRAPLREMAPPRSRRRDQPRASGERRSAATMRRDVPADLFFIFVHRKNRHTSWHVQSKKKLLTRKTGTPISLPLSILSWSSRVHTPLPRDRVQAMATVGHTSVAGGSLP